MDTGGDFNSLSVGREGGLNLSIPESLFLTDVSQILKGDLMAVFVFEVETDGAEVQSVWVHTKILSGFLVAPVFGFFILYSIDLLMTMAKVEGLFTLGGFQTVGVFELMPSPVGHGVQGHTCPIIKRERLQTRYIDGGSEMAVTDGERGKVVGLRNDGVVTVNNSVTVNTGRHVANIIT